MAPQNPNPREQEQSIRARKQLLFEDDEPLGGPVEAITRKPFAEYLRTTPAAPLSPGVRAALWSAGVVVVLLLIAALLRVAR